jgi:hypothetical protein
MNVKNKIYHVGLNLKTVQEINEERPFPKIDQVSNEVSFLDEKFLICYVRQVHKDELPYLKLSSISFENDGVYSSLTPYDAILECVGDIQNNLTDVSKIRIFEIESDFFEGKIKMFKLNWK